MKKHYCILTREYAFLLLGDEIFSWELISEIAFEWNNEILFVAPQATRDKKELGR